ncbi:hypothetical protein NDU88_001650 [Pleurodeles waltl]|uniref:Reverse transcriptase domain-containing protein n=1 Tax=Pleurodeles waltl TaxID=8319 RepID=A0AAV7VAK6_PLEWA|nr:hypothetical protein NDU88_001650 [Pleurodeles waltl]
MAMLKEALELGLLPDTCREALIAVLPKAGRDPLDVRSYRPLSLLNTDCKLLGKILANRLLPCMAELVHQDQAGFIPGRNTYSNIRNLIRLMSNPPVEDELQVVVSLDIEKAFDTLGWPFLIETLKRMGFGQTYIRWLRTLYTDPKARVKTGDTISEKFSIGRGTRQGCPLSPLLFALAIEPLAARLRMVAPAWGVTDGQTHQIVSLYADDALIFLRDHTVTLPGLLDLLEEFSSVAGLTVNWSKSCIFPMRPVPEAMRTPAGLGGLKWCHTTFKYLGVNIYHDSQDLRDGNLGHVIRSARGSLPFWCSLPLSPMGRVAIAKMIVLPRLLYYFMSLPLALPSSFFRLLNSLLTDLIWGNGRKRIALTRVLQPLRVGGMGAPKFEEYYAAAQIHWISTWGGATWESRGAPEDMGDGRT